MHGYIDIWNRYIYISTDKQNANSIYISETVYLHRILLVSVSHVLGLLKTTTPSALASAPPETPLGPMADLCRSDRWNPQLSIIGWIIGYQCGIISSTMVIIVYNGFYWDLLEFNHQQWEWDCIGRRIPIMWGFA